MSRKVLLKLILLSNGNLKTQFVEHSYIEPEAILAEPAEQGGVKITGCVQNLFSTRRSVAIDVES